MRRKIGKLLTGNAEKPGTTSVDKQNLKDTKQCLKPEGFGNFIYDCLYIIDG